jgi:hypothetical protein
MSSYVKTKLSVSDTDILEEIYDELEKITIPTTFSSPGTKGHYHAVKIGVQSQRDARQTIFGTTTYRGVKQLSKSSKKHPHIIPLLSRFIQSHNSNFKFNSVYVNRNTVAKKHLDSKNAGVSLLVGFGKYTDGETVIYTDTTREFNIQTHSLIFNGSKIYHSSKNFIGIRYSLVFYKNL